MFSRRIRRFMLAAMLLCGVAGPACSSDADRDRWLQPQRVLDAVGVKPGMVIAEVGAGRGYFTLKLARRVGPDGVVYANDIDAAALRDLEGRIRDASLDNVVTVRGEVEDPLLPDRSLDMVFMVYALHDFDRPVALLRNLRRCLDVHTTVVVLDEDPEVTGDHHFLSAERVRELFAKAGYEEVPTEDFLERDLLLVFRTPERS